MGPNYKINQTGRFLREVNRLCNDFHVSDQLLDEVLHGVLWALESNPEAHDEIPNSGGLRLVKTMRNGKGPDAVPQLRIWYRVDGSLVYIVSVEPTDAIL